MSLFILGISFGFFLSNLNLKNRHIVFLLLLFFIMRDTDSLYSQNQKNNTMAENQESSELLTKLALIAEGSQNLFTGKVIVVFELREQEYYQVV